ncbi:beta-ketoacyl synthase N-terminal-like domain-containing protein [Streptomyces sp. FXJ1.172]|uniref:beta-ketoacyl synthase N-terminal-like domain-containing protein n=1 Tax=Streptomyces sp. FXJ1.172 TaxID=710705 RepID=UPI0007CF1D3D|nr:beta-ketoacyl synthase N-terminal-like domain-containing protein [Streptomyces sp. FXJ1.172]WEO94741.1 beta-ketoacyl synthase N-terminal-like domain-containing protein [Streptomyces sp. FXJ1.172]
MSLPVRTAVTGVGLAVPGAASPEDLLAPVPSDAEPVSPAARIGKKGLRYKDRATQLALACADEALRDAGLLGPDGLNVPGETVAVLVASNHGNADTVCSVAQTIATEGTTAGISPMDTPNASSNIVASTLAIKYGLRGPNLMICNGPTSGIDAVRWAVTVIGARRADRALVLATEPDNPVVRRLTGAERIVDGAAALVVENQAAAAVRGATRRAVVGPGLRVQGVQECLRRLAETQATTPGAFFGPGKGAVESSPVLGTDTARYELTDSWGELSAVLGVLQCVGAVGWFARGGTGPVYALAGQDGDDATAGLTLLPPAGTG